MQSKICFGIKSRRYRLFCAGLMNFDDKLGSKSSRFEVYEDEIQT